MLPALPPGGSSSPIVPMSKPGFPHHGQFTSVTGRKMLSRRGGLKGAATLRLTGFKALIAAAARGRLTRTRLSIPKGIKVLDAQCARAHGCTLLEYLLTHGSDAGSDS